VEVVPAPAGGEGVDFLGEVVGGDHVLLHLLLEDVQLEEQVLALSGEVGLLLVGFGEHEGVVGRYFNNVVEDGVRWS